MSYCKLVCKNTSKTIQKQNEQGFSSSFCPLLAAGLSPLEDEFLFGRGNDDGRTFRRQHHQPGKMRDLNGILEVSINGKPPYDKKESLNFGR